MRDHFCQLARFVEPALTIGHESEWLYRAPRASLSHSIHIGGLGGAQGRHESRAFSERAGAEREGAGLGYE